MHLVYVKSSLGTGRHRSGTVSELSDSGNLVRAWSLARKSRMRRWEHCFGKSAYRMSQPDGLCRRYTANFFHQITTPVITIATSRRLDSDTIMCPGKPQTSPV